MLLYKKEQKQYKEEIKGDVSPSSVYGAEHLLRLFGMLNYPLRLVFLIYPSLQFLSLICFIRALEQLCLMLSY
jgi:mortality factor 4-like protein 1